jgi:hypothetical protein
MGCVAVLVYPRGHLRAPPFADGSRMLTMTAPINLLMQWSRLCIVGQSTI